MKRRIFLNVVGSVPLAAVTPPAAVGLALTAIAAEHLPQKAVLHGYGDSEPGDIFEMRSYEDGLPSEDLLARHGIPVLLAEPPTLLTVFPNLEARDRAWTALASDEEWVRNRRNTVQITLYRVE